MIRRVPGLFVLLACTAASSGFVGARYLCAQADDAESKVITLRMLDSRTGRLIATTDYLVRIDHKQEVHSNWVTQNEDGSGRVKVPADTEVISVHATYDGAMQTYVNCDSNKDHGSSEHAAGLDRWYSVADITASGVVAPNYCVGKKVPEKLQVVAEPGQLVFFVRKLNPKEQFEQ